MVRTQIQLTEAQARALKELATQRGVSMAELVRESVERILRESEEDEKWRRALALMGRYREGTPDVSTNHDKYLDEEYLK
ncbi:MAG: ribbon-helix-helix protein, CopG family [Chloroflexi bacterium]|nr:ribbon-helix-helix protein, CopG family [Chloroflexota bacterium]